MSSLPVGDGGEDPREPRRVPILHVRVDALSRAETLARIEKFIAEQRRPRQVVTANPLMILASEKDPGLRRAFEAADLVIPDSAGVALAAWLSGRALPEKISGIDLLQDLCARAAKKGWSVFLLGAAPGVAERAAKNLVAQYPGLNIVGTHHGYFTESGEGRMGGERGITQDSVIQKVSRAAPDLLFVALDLPRQDGWIQANLPRLGGRVAMGVGGSFDVISGRLRRAPAWMRAAGLEWLFRLLQEPCRARRMLGLPVFLWRVLSAGIGKRRSDQGL